MYLIDLKGGLEMTDFKDSERVEIISNVKDAVDVLGVKEEMEDRFEHLKSIEENDCSERDGMPRIVLGIDECSVLYMKRIKEVVITIIRLEQEKLLMTLPNSLVQQNSSCISNTESNKRNN